MYLQIVSGSADHSHDEQFNHCNQVLCNLLICTIRVARRGPLVIRSYRIVRHGLRVLQNSILERMSMKPLVLQAESKLEVFARAMESISSRMSFCDVLYRIARDDLFTLLTQIESSSWPSEGL